MSAKLPGLFAFGILRRWCYVGVTVYPCLAATKEGVPALLLAEFSYTAWHVRNVSGRQQLRGCSRSGLTVRDRARRT